MWQIAKLAVRSAKVLEKSSVLHARVVEVNHLGIHLAMVDTKLAQIVEEPVLCTNTAIQDPVTFHTLARDCSFMAQARGSVPCATDLDCRSQRK